ncbi:hypothetical protein ILYODFUR_034995 [Ilyodon furcidens]|uniref:Uncharacterized protein n=1 Tax=Ilyodon furcidens TaxID=33524 RepID=A0ABV0TDM3_9TELE
MCSFVQFIGLGFFKSSESKPNLSFPVQLNADLNGGPVSRVDTLKTANVGGKTASPPIQTEFNAVQIDLPTFKMEEMFQNSRNNRLPQSPAGSTGPILSSTSYWNSDRYKLKNRFPLFLGVCQPVNYSQVSEEMARRYLNSDYCVNSSHTLKEMIDVPAKAVADNAMGIKAAMEKKADDFFSNTNEVLVATPAAEGKCERYSAPPSAHIKGRTRKVVGTPRIFTHVPNQHDCFHTLRGLPCLYNKQQDHPFMIPGRNLNAEKLKHVEATNPSQTYKETTSENYKAMDAEPSSNSGELEDQQTAAETRNLRDELQQKTDRLTLIQKAHLGQWQLVNKSLSDLMCVALCLVQPRSDRDNDNQQMPMAEIEPQRRHFIGQILRWPCRLFRYAGATFGNICRGMSSFLQQAGRPIVAAFQTARTRIAGFFEITIIIDGLLQVRDGIIEFWSEVLDDVIVTICLVSLHIDFLSFKLLMHYCILFLLFLHVYNYYNQHVRPYVV